ncbi:MAG: ABC transporter permease [Erysipelotrichaceae bacterium]|nr:ABC transporter permease [Erysipelotrichaceae bacterium]
MTNKKAKKLDLSITNETVFSFVKTFIAILIALAITFVVLCVVSKNPVNAFVTILTGALRKTRYIGLVLERTVPYTFAGLACGLLFKAGFFNLGAEGIFVMSGLLISIVAINPITTSPILHPLIAIVAGALVGGVLMLIPAYFKAKFNANELVISLMLNSIYVAIATYVVRNYFLSQSTSLIATPTFLETATIGYIIDKYHVSIMFVLMLIAVIGLQFVLKKTKFGYQVRLAGTNPSFAEYSGIDSFKLAMKTNFIAGMLAGIGSAAQILTQASNFQPSTTVTNIGFTGSLLAMLGRNNPIGILVSTFFIKYLEQGTSVLYYNDTSVPSEIIAIVQGVVVLLVSSQYFLKKFREKKLLQEGLNEHE